MNLEEIDMIKRKKISKKEVEGQLVSPAGKGIMNNEICNNVRVREDNTILVKKTLRSGQSINFDGNVVILGDVNPGGEVIASGNIIIMGSLRGIAHAGATGDETAIVTAFKLKPTQLRIANYITRSPDGDAGDGGEPECPEIAKIKDGIVVIENYPVLGDKQAKVG